MSTYFPQFCVCVCCIFQSRVLYYVDNIEVNVNNYIMST